MHNKVWSSTLDQAARILFLETRNDESKSIQLVRFDLRTFDTEIMDVENPWWTQLVGAKDNKLFYKEYQDEKDPTSQKYFSLDWQKMGRVEVEKVPFNENSTHVGNIYEHGADYHKTVSTFLSLELPLSCEYLEWKDKIIISYYIRSGNAFDRYLLVLDNGDKEWKVCQDKQMKGFSPGAFFVFNDQLIFIKDRNEVCVYTDE